MKENNDLERVFARMKVIQDEVIFYDGQDFLICPQFDFKGVNSHDLIADILYEYFNHNRALDDFLDAYNFTQQFVKDAMIPGATSKKILAEIELLLKEDKWKKRIKEARIIYNSITYKAGKVRLPKQAYDLPF